MSIDLKKASFEEVRTLRAGATRELWERCDGYLHDIAAAYVDILGKKEGMERLCEHVFERCAQRRYPAGWAGLVKHAVKISG